MTTVTTVVPGYIAGTWDIDANHSDVSFSVRHMMVSKVRGRFNGVSGRLVTGDDLLDSSVTAEIDVTSFDTGNPQRDEHIRSADFLHATQFPTMTYRSSGLRWDGDQLMVDGDTALRLGELARTRFDLAGHECAARLADRTDIWPADLEPHFSDATILIERTEPALPGYGHAEEIKNSILASIARAQRSIYIENQFVSAVEIARRLKEKGC